MHELTDDQLLDELGVGGDACDGASQTQEQERIIAGFEDIVRFHQSHGFAPRHEARSSIFERLLAVRLDRIRQMAQDKELLEILAELDTPGLLHSGLVADIAAPVSALGADALLDELGVTQQAKEQDDITVLHHVRDLSQREAPEEIAERKHCRDFARFGPLFAQVKSGLDAGTWVTKPFGQDASIKEGDFFIVGGQIVYVAQVHDENASKQGRFNPRLRVIYDNGTESDLLMLSLSRALYSKGDRPAGRRLIDERGRRSGSLFDDEAGSDDIASGTIYVLRSLSSDPFIAQHRDLIHKIGVTGGKVETRIAHAEHDATYLLAKVEVVATYKLHNINRSKMEHIFHRIFGAAQIDLTLLDRFGRKVRPREWFLVPLPIINESVQRIIDGTVTKVVYDPKLAQLVELKAT